MSEEMNIPTLTLDPAGDEAAAAAAAQAAPAAPETATPSLTLTPEAPVAQAVEEEKREFRFSPFPVLTLWKCLSV